MIYQAKVPLKYVTLLKLQPQFGVKIKIYVYIYIYILFRIVQHMSHVLCKTTQDRSQKNISHFY